MNIRVDDRYLIDDRFLVEDDPGGPRYPGGMMETIQPVYSPSVGVSATTPKPVTLVTVQPASPVSGVYGAMPISSSPSTNVLSTPTVDLTPAQQAALAQAQVLSEQLAAEQQGIPTWVYLAGGALVVFLLTR